MRRAPTPGFGAHPEIDDNPRMRPATAIVVLVLLAVIVIAAIVQAIELLSPPGSVPSQLPG